MLFKGYGAKVGLGNMRVKAENRMVTGVVAPTGQQPEEVTLRAYGPFADYLRKHPFHHSQVERNDMGTFTSFDYTLLVTDELVDEILALGDKVEITFPEKLRMKLLQKIGRIRNRYMVI